MIFHVTTLDEFVRGTADGMYRPGHLATDGFVHASPTLDVARKVIASYYANATSPVLILELDESKLSSPVKREAAAPRAGGAAHREGVALFPHVYGPIELAAVVRIHR